MACLFRSISSRNGPRRVTVSTACPSTPTRKRQPGATWDIRRTGRERIILEVNAHPPTSVLLALPLAGLTFSDAFLAWDLLSLVALGVSIGLVVTNLKIPFSLWSLLPTLTLLLLCEPVRSHLAYGQLNLYLLPLITGAWVANRSGRPWWAGSLLGLATAIKLFPGFLFLFFLVRKQWKVVLAGVAGFTVATLLTTAVLGPEAYRDYVQKALPQVGEWRSNWSNASLVGLWSKLFNPGTKGPHVTPLMHSPVLAHLASLVSCATVSILVAWVAWQARSQAQCDLAFGLMLVAMLLVSPMTWEHYLVLLLLPLAWLWQKLPATALSRSLFWGILVILWVPPHLMDCLYTGVRPTYRWSVPTSPARTLLAFSWSLYALLGLLILGTVQAYRARMQPEDTPAG